MNFTDVTQFVILFALVNAVVALLMLGLSYAAAHWSLEGLAAVERWLDRAGRHRGPKG